MKLLMSFVKSCLVNLVVLGCLIQQLDYSNILNLPKPFSLIFLISTFFIFFLQMVLLQISALVGSHSKHLNHFFFFSFFSMSTHMYDITSNQKTICTTRHTQITRSLFFLFSVFIFFFPNYFLYSFIWLTDVNFTFFFFLIFFLLLFLDCV